VNYRWERLADGVYRTRLPFLDVTVGVVHGRDGVLLIDTGSTLTEAAAIDMDVRSITGRTVTQVVLTHNHFDHILGSPAFVGAAVYAAPEVAETMSGGTEPVRIDAVRHGADPGEIDRAIAALRPPDHLVREAVIDLGDRTARVSHPGPGHTGHDLIVVVGDHRRTVVFCGDLVEESGDPAVDSDSDVATWPVTLNRLIEAGGPQAVFVPGHGAVVDSGFIRRQQDWLRRQRRGV
jgi:glyoxylase-like metal-dependent hydrolase (beta-lactamase superfamily II)